MTKIGKRYRKTIKEAFKRIEKQTSVWMAARNREVKRWTPIDEGDLRDSMYMIKQVKWNGDIIFEAGFTSPYAPVVHEWPNESTNWSKDGTGAKYLELPYMMKAQGLPRYIQRTAKLKVKI